MGESSACLMQPFCYASGLSNEANESNPNHALGQSVSFGRFMSESLSWEKWSSFSHNRYVEEAERFSRPGSVAQKKAFFEAHYKKLAAQKAAALLEQAKNAAQTKQEHEAVVESTHNSQTTTPKSKLVAEENAKVLKCEPGAMLRANGHNSNPNMETNLPQSKKVEAQMEMEHQAFEGKSMLVSFQNQLEADDGHRELNGKVNGTPPMDTPELKQGSNSEQEVLQSICNSKVPASSFKLLEVIGTSKFTSTPVKSTASALISADKKRSVANSLRVSLNLIPIREINKLTASVMRKFDSTRVGAGSSRASKDSSTPPTTPTKASKNELQNHSSLTRLTEKKRNKMASTIISSPFSLRTEERAAARGEKKLEDKFNDNEAQNVQLHTKLKDKAKKKIRKLRISFCFTANSLPEFYNEKETSKREIDKDPLTQPEPSKQGIRPPPSVVKSKNSFKRPSLSNNDIKNFQGKNGSTLTPPLTSNSTVITTHENTSPNIHMETRMTEITNKLGREQNIATGYCASS